MDQLKTLLPNLYERLQNQENIFIAILTPFYGGQGNVRYFNSLIKMIFNLGALGIRSTFLYTDYESLVQRGRNTLVANSMSNPEITHLFFIDSDIEFSEIEILKLLNDDKNITGGIYPQKRYQFEKLAKVNEFMDRNLNDLNKHISPEVFLKHNLLNYNLNGKVTQIVNNNIKLDHIATGFMLIKREVFNKMIIEHPEWKYKDDIGCMTNGAEPYLHAFFDCYIHEGRYLSEDYGFCRRWLDMGGEIYANVSIELNHIGQCVFEGRLMSTLDLNVDKKESGEKE